MPHDEIIAMDGTLWMTKRTYQKFKKQIMSSSALSSALDKKDDFVKNWVEA